MSIRTTTVEDFCAQIGGSKPVPAGVSISAVSAAMALSLLAKVLDITARRKDFRGDRSRIDALIAASRVESAGLTELADADVRAFDDYLACVRSPGKTGAADAMCKCVEVPLEGARAALRGMDLCAEGVAMVHGLTAADLAMAATMLHAALRAMLISVDFNLRLLDSATESFDRMKTERRELELAAAHRDDVIASAVRTLV
jgi:formiminotetrahydrofolate cyclodeaminase